MERKAFQKESTSRVLGRKSKKIDQLPIDAILQRYQEPSFDFPSVSQFMPVALGYNDDSQFVRDVMTGVVIPGVHQQIMDAHHNPLIIIPFAAQHCQIHIHFEGDPETGVSIIRAKVINNARTQSLDLQPHEVGVIMARLGITEPI